MMLITIEELPCRTVSKLFISILNGKINRVLQQNNSTARVSRKIMGIITKDYTFALRVSYRFVVLEVKHIN